MVSLRRPSRRVKNRDFFCKKRSKRQKTKFDQKNWNQWATNPRDPRKPTEALTNYIGHILAQCNLQHLVHDVALRLTAAYGINYLLSDHARTSNFTVREATNLATLLHNVNNVQTHGYVTPNTRPADPTYDRPPFFAPHGMPNLMHHQHFSQSPYPYLSPSQYQYSTYAQPTYGNSSSYTSPYGPPVGPAFRHHPGSHTPLTPVHHGSHVAQHGPHAMPWSPSPLNRSSVAGPHMHRDVVEVDIFEGHVVFSPLLGLRNCLLLVLLRMTALFLLFQF